MAESLCVCVCVSSPHRHTRTQHVLHSWHHNKLCDQFPWFPLTVSRYRQLREVNRRSSSWCTATGTGTQTQEDAKQERREGGS